MGPLAAIYLSAGELVLAVADYVSEILDDFPVRRVEIMSETGLDSIPPPLDRSRRRGPVELLRRQAGAHKRGKGRSPGAQPHQEDLDFVFDVVGDGPERETCEQLTEELGLSDRIVFHGWRAKSEVSAFYERSDVFVFPSYREAGGNVTLEAMSHSLPLIVCNRGGPGSATSDCCAIRIDVVTPDELTKSLVQAIRLLVADEAAAANGTRGARSCLSDGSMVAEVGSNRCGLSSVDHVERPASSLTSGNVSAAAAAARWPGPSGQRTASPNKIAHRYASVAIAP